MVYLCEKGSEEKKKTCNDCQTTKTPLWRKGPAGPKSLCNACGIKYRKIKYIKKRRALIGINKGGSTMEKKLSIDKKSLIGKKSRFSHSDNKINNNKRDSKLTVSSKLRLLTLGREVMMQRCSIEKQRMNLGEEEQAAVLLMALSCGSVYG